MGWEQEQGRTDLGAISLCTPFLPEAHFAGLEEAGDSLTTWCRTSALQKPLHLGSITRTLWLDAVIYEVYTRVLCNWATIK